jgi:hypothetical protein
VSFLETIEPARAFLERQQRLSLCALQREFGRRFTRRGTGRLRAAALCRLG